MEICCIWLLRVVHSCGVFLQLVLPPLIFLKVFIFFLFHFLCYFNLMSYSHLMLEPRPMDETETINHTVNAVSNTMEDVDEQLWKLDGKIQRKRDEKL